MKKLVDCLAHRRCKIKLLSYTTSILLPTVMLSKLKEQELNSKLLSFLNLKPPVRFLMCIVLLWYHKSSKFSSGHLMHVASIFHLATSLGFPFSQNNCQRKAQSIMKRVVWSTWKTELFFSPLQDLRSFSMHYYRQGCESNLCSGKDYKETPFTQVVFSPH